MEVNDIYTFKDLLKYVRNNLNQIIVFVFIAIAICFTIRGFLVKPKPLPPGFTVEDFQ